MKKILLSIWVLFLFSCTNTKQQNEISTGSQLKGDIQLSGAFALYPIAVKWAEEFKKLHPHVRIDISGGGAGKGITDALSGMVDIGMVSREIYDSEVDKGAFSIGVVRDAVVPTISSNNPEIDVINKVGLSQSVAAKLWTNQITTWGEVLSTSSKVPVHVFTRSDACGAAETWAKWLGMHPEDMEAVAVFGDPGIASIVQKDKASIGYNNVAYVYNVKTKAPYEGIKVIPIDFNGNGVIDPEEDFYQNLDSLTQAISDGRYRKPLARNLYLVTKGKPQKPVVVEFLKYILSDGQQFASTLGYVALDEESVIAGLNKLNIE